MNSRPQLTRLRCTADAQVDEGGNEEFSDVDKDELDLKMWQGDEDKEEEEE